MQHTLPNQSHVANFLKVVLWSVVLLTPFLIFPAFQNIYDIPKQLYIWFWFVTILTCWGIIIWQTKKIELLIHPLTLPLTFFMGSLIISSLFNAPAVSETFSSIYGSFFLLIISTLIAPHLLKISTTKTFLELVMAAGLGLSIISFLQIIGIGPSLFLNRIFNLDLAENFAFATTGSPLASFTFLIPVFATVVFDLFKSFDRSKIFHMVASVVMGIAIILHLGLFFTKPEFNPNILNWAVNWSIAVENLKSFKTAVLGVGPNNFLDAFTLHKPVQLNARQNWTVLYQIGSNTPLTFLVTLGLFGLVSWLLLLIQSLRLLKSTPQKLQSVGVLAVSLLLIQLFLPPSLLLFVFQAISWIVWLSALHTHQHNLVNQVLIRLHLKPTDQVQLQHSKLEMSTYVVVLLIGLVVLGSGFYQIKAVLADYFYFQSLRATQANNGTKAYDHQRRAISLAPFRDQFRRSYAQTNFALANSLSNRDPISEQDQLLIGQLLQQSIREARNAASINPHRTVNWRSLAEIYRALTGSTPGAEQWALAAYIKAIETHPHDPALRLDLGTLFMSVENYEQAEILYRQAVQLKPDYANGYYNLAKVFVSQQKLPQAIAALERVLQLIDPSSQDYITAQAELATIKESIPQLDATEAQTKSESDSLPSEQEKPTEVSLPAEINQQQEELEESLEQSENHGLSLTASESSQVIASDSATQSTN